MPSPDRPRTKGRGTNKDHVTLLFGVHLNWIWRHKGKPFQHFSQPIIAHPTKFFSLGEQVGSNGCEEVSRGLHFASRGLHLVPKSSTWPSLILRRPPFGIRGPHSSWGASLFLRDPPLGLGRLFGLDRPPLGLRRPQVSTRVRLEHRGAYTWPRGPPLGQSCRAAVPSSILINICCTGRKYKRGYPANTCRVKKEIYC